MCCRFYGTANGTVAASPLRSPHLGLKRPPNTRFGKKPSRRLLHLDRIALATSSRSAAVRSCGAFFFHRKGFTVKQKGLPQNDFLLPQHSANALSPISLCSSLSYFTIIYSRAVLSPMGSLSTHLFLSAFLYRSILLYSSSLSSLPFFYFLQCFIILYKNLPVALSGVFLISSKTPAATIRPPASPPPGPISMI